MTEARKRLLRWKFARILRELPECTYSGPEMAHLHSLFLAETTRRARRQAEREGRVIGTMVGDGWVRG